MIPWHSLLLINVVDTRLSLSKFISSHRKWLQYDHDLAVLVLDHPPNLQDVLVSSLAIRLTAATPIVRRLCVSLKKQCTRTFMM